MTAANILRQAADLFHERNALYRDNWKDVGAALLALFPQGIMLKTEEDHTRFHFVMLMVVKLSRYANMWHDGHSDSLRDLAVYSAMLESFDKEFFQPNKAIEHGVAYFSDSGSLISAPWPCFFAGKKCTGQHECLPCEHKITGQIYPCIDCIGKYIQSIHPSRL